MFKISGFKYIDSFRANNAGGVRIFYRESMELKLMPNYTNVTNICEVLTVEIVRRDINIMLCCFYHPPSPDHYQNRLFIEQCSGILDNLRTRGLPVIVCGDFNLNLLNPLRLRYISDFIDSMLECNMSPIITIPTKFNPSNVITSYSLID